MKGFNLLCKKAKTVLCSALSVLTVACLALGIAVMPKTQKVNAETATSPIYATKVYDVDIVMNGTTPFYCWNPNEPGTWYSWWYIQSAANYLTYNVWGNNGSNEYDMAMVWTAPKDGTFWAERYSGDSTIGNIAITSELGTYNEAAPQTVDVAFAKGTISNGVASNLTSLVSDTNENSIFRTITAKQFGTQTNTVIGYGAPISIKAGESFMIIVKKPSNHHQVRLNNVTLKFVEDGKTNEEAVSYALQKEVLTEDGYAAKNYFSCIAIDTDSYVQYNPVDVSGYAASTILPKRSELQYCYMGTPTIVDGVVTSRASDGMMFAYEKSTSHISAVRNLSTLIVTSSNVDPAFVHQVAEDGIVEINDIYLRSRDTANYVDNYATVEVVWQHTEDGKTVYTSLSNGEQLVNYKNSVEYNLQNLCFRVQAGDSIIIKARKLLSDDAVVTEQGLTIGNVNVLVDIDMEVNGKSYVLSQTTATTTVQNEYGFYYGFYELVNTVTLNELTSFAMTEGASIRLNDDASSSGIRFQAQMTKTEYYGLQIYYDELEFGVVMMPEDYLTTHGALTKETVLDGTIYSLTKTSGKVQILGAKSVKMYTYTNSGADNNHVYLRYSMVKVNAGNYDRAFVATAYIKAVKDGKTEYQFLNVTKDDKTAGSVRSIKEVAGNMLDAGAVEAGSQKEALLKKYAGRE